MTLVQKKNPFKQVSKYLWQHPESEIGNDSSLLLLTAGRKYFTYNDLSPSLELDDSIIILNRSYLSNLAYHASCPERLPALMLLSYFDIPADIKLMLECDTAAAYTRIIARSLQKGGIIYPNEKPEYIDRVKKNFHELSKFVDGMIFIDSSGRQDEVSKHICSIVDDYFKEKR
jgi:thymidylate kinase